MGPESSSAWEEELPVFRDTEGRSTAGLGVAIVSGSLGVGACTPLPCWEDWLSHWLSVPEGSSEGSPHGAAVGLPALPRTAPGCSPTGSSEKSPLTKTGLSEEALDSEEGVLELSSGAVKKSWVLKKGCWKTAAGGGSGLGRLSSGGSGSDHPLSKGVPGSAVSVARTGTAARFDG